MTTLHDRQAMFAAAPAELQTAWRETVRLVGVPALVGAVLNCDAYNAAPAEEKILWLANLEAVTNEMAEAN